MFKNIKIFLFLICSINISFAQVMGGHDGGGGNGVICYDEGGNIKSVELLDFYEGRILENLNIPEYEGNYLDIYKRIISKAASKKIHEILGLGVKINSWFKFLPKEHSLKSIPDSGEIFIPKNCEIKQLANFQGTNRVFVASDMWNKMSETSKAGLLLHEHIWTLERESGAQNSSRARRTVARFFAENYQFSKINHQVKSGDLLCYAYNPKHRFHQAIGNAFYISKQAGTDSCTLTFQMINSTFSFSQHTSTINHCSDWKFHRFADRANIPSTEDAQPLFDMLEVVRQPENQVTHEVIIYSELDHDPKTNSYVETLKYKILNKEFPGYDEDFSELKCYKLNNGA